MTSFQNLPRWLQWGLAFPLFFLNVWLLLLLFKYLQPIPSVVLTASLIAFLLDYPIIFLEQRGVRRGWAIALVVLTALMLLSLIGFVLGPLVFQQFIEFSKRLPSWIEQVRTQLEALDEQTVLGYLPMDLSALTAQLTTQISDTLKSVTTRVVSFTLDTFNSAFNLLVTIILTVLMMLSGKKLWDGIFSWFPSKYNHQIQISLQQSLQGYFIGQSILALILGTVLSLAFVILQIPFGLLFGFGIGVASLIPFGGTLSITFVSIFLGFQSLGLGAKVLISALILGQFNENVVAPRLIGDITGLNPAVVLISLLIGVKVGGFLGLLFAVPTASFIKRFAEIIRSSNSDPNQREFESLKVS